MLPAAVALQACIVAEFTVRSFDGSIVRCTLYYIMSYYITLYYIILYYII